MHWGEERYHFWPLDGIDVMIIISTYNHNTSTQTIGCQHHDSTDTKALNKISEPCMIVSKLSLSVLPSNDGFWKPDKSYGISGTCESLEIQWHCPVDYFEVVSDQLLWSPIGHNFQGHNQAPKLNLSRSG